MWHNEHPSVQISAGIFSARSHELLFFQHGQHQLEIFLTTLENSNLGLNPVEYPFFLPFHFIKKGEFQPLQSPVKQQHLN